LITIPERRQSTHYPPSKLVRLNAIKRLRRSAHPAPRPGGVVVLGFDKIVDPLADLASEALAPADVDPGGVGGGAGLVGLVIPAAAKAFNPTSDDNAVGLDPRRRRRRVALDDGDRCAGRSR
jgi:hypothetical protein